MSCNRHCTSTGGSHKASGPGRLKDSHELPLFRRINTRLGNLKTTLSRTFHSFDFDKYARRYKGNLLFHLNWHFVMAETTKQMANAVSCCMPCTERDPKIAEVYGYSRRAMT
jgi:hypothetical protein